MKYQLATTDHVPALLADMRPLDWQEATASAGPDIATTVANSVRLSHNPWVVFDDEGALLAIFGVAPYNLMSDTGAPWLLGTRKLDRHSKTLTTVSRRYLAEMQEFFPKLVNYVDVRNTPSIRWLKRVGFAIDAPAPHGVKGEPFHRFHMGSDDV
jgi:hypothetical protein